MRESLSASVSASQMFGQASNNNGRSSTAKDSDHDLAASVAETDELLSMFGESFASLSETSTIIQSSKKSHHMGSKPNHRRSNTNTIPEGTEMTFGTQDSLEVSGMLEKYSDRLAELVSEKVLAKLSKN